MKGTKKLENYQEAARNDTISRQKEMWPARLSGVPLECQPEPFHAQNTESSLEIPSYVDNLPGKQAKIPIKSHSCRKGTDKDFESEGAGHGVFIDPELTRVSEELESKQPLLMASLPLPGKAQGVGSEFLDNIFYKSQPCDGGSGTKDIDYLLSKCGRPNIKLERCSEIKAASIEDIFIAEHPSRVTDIEEDTDILPINHIGLEIKDQNTTNGLYARVIDTNCRPFSQISILDGAGGFGEPKAMSHTRHKVEAFAEMRTLDITKQFFTSSAAQFTSGWALDGHTEDAHQKSSNQISFKFPAFTIPGIESFGFPFGPRLEESPVDAAKSRPIFNPFEDIEKQGRYSLLNHPRSLEGSRHHSRRSTLGLQAFGPLPSVMKTSKETGDQPPVLPSPPCMSCNVKVLCSSPEYSEVMETTSTAESYPCLDGGSCYKERHGGGGKMELSSDQLGPVNMGLNIEDFDILFSPKKQLKPYEGSSPDRRAEIPPNTDPNSQKYHYHVRKTDFATLGAESIWTSPRPDRGKTLDGIQGEPTCCVDSGSKGSINPTELN